MIRLDDNVLCDPCWMERYLRFSVFPLRGGLIMEMRVVVMVMGGGLIHTASFCTGSDGVAGPRLHPGQERIWCRGVRGLNRIRSF